MSGCTQQATMVSPFSRNQPNVHSSTSQKTPAITMTAQSTLLGFFFGNVM